MEAILVMLSPFAVSGVTWVIKKLGVTSPLSNGWETAVLRLIVAALSFGAIVGSAKLTGVPVEATSIQTFVLSVMTFFGATGVYFFSSKKA